MKSDNFSCAIAGLYRDGLGFSYKNVLSKTYVFSLYAENEEEALKEARKRIDDGFFSEGDYFQFGVSVRPLKVVIINEAPREQSEILDSELIG